MDTVLVMQNFSYDVTTDDEQRARRAEYREQMHYARRYSGLTGGFFEKKDNIADAIGENGRALVASFIIFFIAAAVIYQGWSWWFILWVPVALLSLVGMIGSAVMWVKQGVDWFRDL